MTMQDEPMPEIIWANTVDGGRYACQVVGLDGSNGRLTVTRMSDGEQILDELVPLAYGAVMGPDVDDVATWQDKVIKAIDELPREEQK